MLDSDSELAPAGMLMNSGTRSGRMFLSTSHRHTCRPLSSQPMVSAVQCCSCSAVEVWLMQQQL